MTEIEAGGRKSEKTAAFAIPPQEVRRVTPAESREKKGRSSRSRRRLGQLMSRHILKKSKGKTASGAHATGNP